MVRRVNLVMAGSLGVSIVAMLGMSFAAVPLYRLFCQATGYNGTPKIGLVASQSISDTRVEIRFDANTNSALPWKFVADERTVSVALGEEVVATYTGENQGARTMTGVATYNVMPDKAARYFHKTACFCFNEQTLMPGQRMSFPLSFWVDPAIASDPDTRDVHSIILSYTFFRSIDDAARNGGLDRAGPHVGSRAEAKSASNFGLISR